MPSDEDIERYIAIKVKSNEKKYLKKVHGYIADSAKYFASKGISTPSAGDFEDLRQWVSSQTNAKETTTWVNHTIKFYEWLNGQNDSQQLFLDMPTEKEDIMFKVTDPDVNGALNDAGQVSDAGQVRDTGQVQGAATDAVIDAPIDKPKRKGRKVLDPNGERRSEKVMLYLRPSLMTDVKDLACLKGKSVADYVIGLIEDVVASKQKKLALFRELRETE